MVPKLNYATLEYKQDPKIQIQDPMMDQSNLNQQQGDEALFLNLMEDLLALI